MLISSMANIFCNHEGCSYLATTHEKVWDGNELEWEPEKTNETEDITPFEKVGLGVIKYFCHEHHLNHIRILYVYEAWIYIALW